MLEQGRIIFSPAAIAGLSERCGAAQKAGDLGMVKRIQALLALAENVPLRQVAAVLQCSVQAIYIWLREFILD